MSEEGPIAIYYTYAAEIIYLLWLIGFSIKEFLKAKTKELRREIIVLTVGTVLLLLAFSSGNIISSFTEDWRFAQIGLLAMPVFIGFLVYSIIRFGTFNFRLIGSVTLIVALLALLFSLLFINDISTARIIVLISFVLACVFSAFLIRSVTRDIQQREQIERLAKDFAKANKRLRELDQMKSEFLSFATHQLRSPLTAISGYASLVLEGSFGSVSDTVRGAVDKIFQSSRALIVVVEDFLNVSRIEQGRMKYDFSAVDLKRVAKEVIAEQMPTIERAGLAISFDAPKGEDYIVRADFGKIKQVVGNIIDNAIKYTPHGSITVSLKRDLTQNKIALAVADTGMGISKDALPMLFEKFERARNARQTDVTGTGLGLFLAKEIMKAHRGHIYAESKGEGKGSIFYLEFDTNVILGS